MPEAALWPALFLAALGALLDITTRRLPNWLCLAFALAAGAGLALSQGLAMLPWALLHALIALVAGMLLFRLNMIGGGDAKFYAAAAFGVPASSLGGPMALLGWTSAAGLALLLVMLTGRRIAKSSSNRDVLKGWEVPYGVAIAAGFWLTQFLTWA